jgi:hypothetical protein
MKTFEETLKKLQDQAAELRKRSVSNPEDMGLGWEREAIADLLHNQIEIIKAIHSLDSALLTDIRSGREDG